MPSPTPHSRRRYQDADRRTDPRFHVRIPVLVQAEGTKRMRRTVDISCGGARIAYDPTSRCRPPLGPVRLEFRSPSGGDPVEIVGLTMWRSPDSYGVKFIVADELERLAVAELIDQGMRAAAA
jgi:PilZ domain